jgi:hypothetical protein
LTVISCSGDRKVSLSLKMALEELQLLDSQISRLDQEMAELLCPSLQSRGGGVGKRSLTARRIWPG